MPSTACQLRQPLTIEAISRVPYFPNIGGAVSFVGKGSSAIGARVANNIKEVNGHDLRQ